MCTCCCLCNACLFAFQWSFCDVQFFQCTWTSFILCSERVVYKWLFNTVTFSGIYLFLNEDISWKLDVKFSLFAWTFFYTLRIYSFIFFRSFFYPLMFISWILSVSLSVLKWRSNALISNMTMRIKIYSTITTVFSLISLSLVVVFVHFFIKAGDAQISECKMILKCRALFMFIIFLFISPMIPCTYWLNVIVHKHMITRSHVFLCTV